MNLSKPVMQRNAARIVELADAFGHLVYNDTGQKVEETLNLSIPCARLVKAGIVLAVDDTADGVNDSAVADVEHSCSLAVLYTIAKHGESWEWRQEAERLGLDLPKAEETAVLNALYWKTKDGPAHLHEIENGLRAVGLGDAERIAPVLDRLVADGRAVRGQSTFAAVWSLPSST